MEPLYLATGASPHSGHVHEAVNCLQYYSYIRQLGFIFAGNAYTARGTLIHLGLAHSLAERGALQKGEKPGCKVGSGQFIQGKNVVLPPLVAMERYYRENTELLSQADFENCTRAVLAWNTANVINGHRIVGVEALLTGHVTMPWGSVPYTQRADLITQYRGNYYLWDHKSCYRMEKQAPARYRFHFQFLGLETFGRTRYGKHFGGVVLNRLCLVPTKDGAYKHDQHNMANDIFANTRFWDWVYQKKLMVKWAEDNFSDPWNWPRAMSESHCKTITGELCPGWNLCVHGQSAASHYERRGPQPSIATGE